MAKVNRGEWTPPAEPEPPRAAARTFQVEASEWLHRQAVKAGDPECESKTMRDLEWRLSVVMDVFGPVRIDGLGYRHAEDVVARLVQERLAIEHARELGAPLMDTRTNPRTGRTYKARRRGVANTSIRRALDVATRVLRDAKRRGALSGELPELKDAAPKAEAPKRSFLEPEQIVAVLRAAEEIEAKHRGLTWETVGYIRRSDASAVALARELGVSDTLIRKVRRGELCDVPPRRAMYLMGHTDATFTMGVYQQVLDMGPGSVEALESVLGCTLAEARAVYVGHGVLPPNSHPTTKTAPAAELGSIREA